MTDDQFETLLQKMESIEKRLEIVEEGNKKLASWIAGARLGVKMIVGSGYALNWVIRAIVAVLSLLGLASALHHGKWPSISFNSYTNEGE